MNKASGGDRIPVELFQILKDDAMKVLHSMSTKELMLLNCGVGEDFWESLGLQEDPTSQS